MKQKTKELLELSIHDALSNLSTIADMDVNLKTPLGFVKKNKVVIQNEEFSYKTIDWVIPEDAEDLIDNIKETYLVVLNYLKEIYEKDFIDWNDYRCKKGIEAIIVIAADAASTIDKYIKLLPKQPNIESITKSQEYKNLQDFYINNIQKKFKAAPEGEEAWSENWEENDNSLLLDIDRSGLKDFETLKKDKEYEIFYLVNDEEKPFFNLDSINNIKAFCDYDELGKVKIEEDPLIKIRSFVDKDFQIAAHQIIEKAKEHITEYFHLELFKKSEDSLIKLVNKTIYALFLAANKDNLIERTAYKNSMEYFYDFQKFLRDTLASEEYKKMLTYQDVIENKMAKKIIHLVFSLVMGLFTKTSSIKQEMVGFIHFLKRKGEEKRKFKYPSKMSIWNKIIEMDESIDVILQTYPNGPMLKLLDVLREEEKKGFDPILQDNTPQRLFQVENKNKKIQFLRLASPTKQTTLSRADVIDEFKCLIRNLKNDEKYLIFNFQDRTSFKEFARCKALDDMQKRAEFKSNLSIVSFSKNTPFYYQTGPYLAINKFEEFKKVFKENLFSENAGYKVSQEYSKIIDRLFDFVHKHFFFSKNVLSRKNKLDFIEVFYQFFILKIIEIEKPTIVSFICKDAVDISTLVSSSFYSFLKIIRSNTWSKENEDFLAWLIYSPALLIRERKIDTQRLNRMISMLNAIDMEMLVRSNKILREMSDIYDPSFLKSIEIIEH